MISLLLACAGEVAPSIEARVAPAASPNIVLVGVAGLRGDPVARAAEAFSAPFGTPLVYTSAYAQSTSPFTSWGTVLTGRYPSAIPLCGVVNSGGAEVDGWCNHIPDTTATLPQVLSLYGYRTAFVYTELAHPETFTTLFDHAERVPSSGGRTDWAGVTKAVHTWWDAADPRPRLLVVAANDLAVQQRPDLLASTGLDAIVAGGAPHLDRKRIHQAYAKAAGEVGSAVAALVGGLSSTRGAWTFAFGVHGMNLADGGGAWQVLRPDQPWNDILVERTLHVPLLVVPPTPQGNRRVEGIVELVDLVPTISRLVGAVEPANLPGADLLGQPAQDATAYAEFGDMLAVRQGDLSYVIRAYFYNRSSLDPELSNFLLGETLDPERHFLYDLRRDPAAEQNVVSNRAEDARRMHALLRSLRMGPGAPPPGQLTDRRVWELRLTQSQGYW